MPWTKSLTLLFSFMTDRQEVVVQHLASAKVNIATVENNAAAIVNALQERGLPMSNRVFEN